MRLALSCIRISVERHCRRSAQAPIELRFCTLEYDAPAGSRAGAGAARRKFIAGATGAQAALIVTTALPRRFLVLNTFLARGTAKR